MKVLHLTSFEGNVGDILYTAPFPQFLSDALGGEVVFTCIHMRDFYRNSKKRSFDTEFLNEINAHDLFVIGGGLYLDVRWDYSNTGTTLDFPDDFIDGIKIPVILNGLGYAEPGNLKEGDPVQKTVFQNFERFIRNISKRKNWFLSVRNDGSLERIAQRFGNNLAGLFKEVPDIGFFFDKDIDPHAFEQERTTVGFSIGNNAFTADDSDIKKTTHLNKGIAQVVQSLITENIRIIFFLHMPSDIDALHQIKQYSGQEAFRNNVVIAPYNPSGRTAGRTMVSYYKACDAIVAMRFHANVLALENTIPTIGLTAEGLVSGERIAALYQNLQLDKFLLKTDETDTSFASRLLDSLKIVLFHREECIKQETIAIKNIMRQRDEYADLLRAFFVMGEAPKPEE
ncbi:MAG: polysaccharide pyruvyl transferase family protein [Clostridiales bacterium]|nr:polysaccharide pyruvyl transferase family protein [Clostridiales bacterium]